MRKASRIILGLGLVLGAVFFYLGYKTDKAQTEGAGSGAGVLGLLKIGVGALGKILKKAGKAAVATAGAAGSAAAAAGGSTAATAAGTTAAVSAGGVTATSGASAGAAAASESLAASGAGALAPVGGLLAFAGLVAVNLFIMFGLGKEPEWHREWRLSGGLAKFTEQQMRAPANLSFKDLGPDEYAGIKGNEPVPEADITPIDPVWDLHSDLGWDSSGGEIR